MPRTARSSAGGVCYHVLNRGNARADVFHDDGDYMGFLELLREANERASMRLLAWCLLPNHFHLVAWPRKDGDLSRWVQWLLTTHVRRYHGRYQSSGHVWQGRSRTFPIQQDEHLLSVIRYVERNPVRAKSIPVRKPQRWPWSSIGKPPAGIEVPKLHAPPVPRGADWLDYVNQPQTEAEVLALRESVRRGRPYGTDRWTRSTARRLGLESSLRPRGRPRKTPKK